jgi:subtilisin family serine protease
LLPLVALSLLTAGFFLFSPTSTAQTQEPTPVRDIASEVAVQNLTAKVQREGTVRVIVGLRGSFQPEGKLGSVEVAEQRADIVQKQNRLLGNLSTARTNQVKKFESIPFVALEVDAAALKTLVDSPDVATIEEDKALPPLLAESVPLVGAPSAWTSGFTGAGEAVAILDTGVDKTHPFLAGKVVSEACYSSTTSSSTSVCPGGLTQSVVSGSGVNCDTTVSGCTHGTHVAGITAGRGASFSGVAKDANIIAIQVFSKFTSATDCGSGPAPCVLSYTSDQLLGLQRVQALSTTYNIASINMSLGGGQYASSCDTSNPSYAAAINNLRSLGIATVIASGNSGYTSAMGFPACLSNAISVGSTGDGSLGIALDQVSSYSNSSSNVTLLAPGQWITSSVPGGGYQTFAGTSMAAPHVAGAWAILKQRKPTASVDEVLNSIISTSVPITDARNGITKPRLKLSALTPLTNDKAVSDFDGDGKTDVAVYRSSNSGWYVQRSTNGAITSQAFGTPEDIATPGDFDGDGKADIAVFRPSNGYWYLMQSTAGFSARLFGQSGDIPAAGDYDGDGKTDTAVFRPSTGAFYIQRSTAGFTAMQFGTNGDKPAVGDYDGDGKADVAVFRPSNGFWYMQRSTDGFTGMAFGISTDYAAQGDYDGDGKTDVAVFRPSNGYWYIMNSSTNGLTATQFGANGDRPAPGDFDGDGRTDTAVFRASSGTWYIMRSTAGLVGLQLGQSGDLPIPSAYLPN